ncbi:MAG: MATE family efflux transporter [Leptotrichiaceae bacterium]|nr:MATE family efflux transporter [Leptotrichiaceae bacterium]
MEKKREELLNSSIFKLFIKYFVPTFIGSIVVVLYNIVDRFFVGKINEQALAGAGVSFYIVMIFIAFAMLVGVGSGTIVSIRLGQRKEEDAEKILGNALTIFTVLGLILFILLKINLDEILIFSGANSETLPYARTYLEIILYAIFPLFFSYGLTNILSAAGAPRVAMFSMILGATVNIVLDYVAIMIMKTGIEGTAYATLIGNILSALFVMYFITAGKLPFKINLFGYELEDTITLRLKFKNLKLSRNIVRDIFVIGMSPFLLQLASSGVGLITNKIVETNGGTYGVAVMTIINSYLPIMTMTVYSAAQAIQPIIGFNYGAENYRRVRKTLLTGIFSGLLLSFIFWIVIMLFPKNLILFFNEKSTKEGLKEGIKAIRIYFSLIIPASLGIILPNYFQATGRPRYSVTLNLLRQVVIFLLVVIIFSHIWQLNGVWYAQPFTDLIFTTVLIIFLFRELRKLKVKETEKNKIEDSDNIR